MKTVPRALRALGMTAVGLLLTTPLHAQRGWRWRADERVVIGDFSFVQAVAASRDAMFAASANGLVEYDRRFRKWGTPFTPADGYDADQVVSAAIDPVDQTLWLGTRSGLTRYQRQGRQEETVPIVGGVSDLAFDRDDPLGGVFFSTRLGWRQLGRGQMVPQEMAPPLPPRRVSLPGLLEVFRRFPSVEALAPTSLLDAQNRSYRFTSAAVTPDADEAYFGTDGLGVLRMDAFGGRLDPMPFGLLSQSVGAVAVDSVVWAGGGAAAGRAGLTSLDPDVQRFEYHEARAGTFESVRDLLLRGNEVWAATERGTAVLAWDGTWRLVDRPSGLPSNNVLVLANARNGVWAGTDRGLARVGAGDSVTVFPSSPTILSLLDVRDTLWIGTTRGLILLPEGADEFLVPRDAGSEPALRGPIVALAAVGDTLVGATNDELVARFPGGTGAWTRLPLVSRQLGNLRALAADSGGVWIGGERGLGFFRFAGKDLSTFRVPDDVPGPVQDLAVRGRFLWVATPDGLVRFDRRALRL